MGEGGRSAAADLIAGQLEMPGLLPQLRRRWRWLAVGAIVAALAAGSHFATIGIFPPSVKAKPFARATASTEVIVGQKPSLLYSFPDPYVRDYSPRAATLADMVASPQVLADVARAAGIPASKIFVDAPLWTQLQRDQQWDTGQKRSRQIVGERDPYRIELSDDANLQAPVFDVVTEAPTGNAAARLARGVTEGLSTYMSGLQAQAGTPLANRNLVNQAAPISVTPASKALLANVAIFTFFGVFALWCAMVLAISSVMRDVRAARVYAEVRQLFHRSSDSGPDWSHDLTRP